MLNYPLCKHTSLTVLSAPLAILKKSARLQRAVLSLKRGVVAVDFGHLSVMLPRFLEELDPAGMNK